MTTQPTGDIAAHRLSSTQLVRIRRHRAAARSDCRGGRRQPLPLLLRRAVRAGLPDADRHPELHPQDRQRQPEGRRDRHPVGESARRDVCPRVSDRDPVRRRMRAQPPGCAARRDRRAAAACNRLGDGDRRGALHACAGHGPRGRGGRRGAGRAACAHRLALAGHRVTLFDARPKGGGLNEYGIAAYKTVDDFAQREVEWLLSVGGITLQTGVALGRDITLDALREQHDAVFLAMGPAACVRCRSTASN